MLNILIESLIPKAFSSALVLSKFGLSLRAFFKDITAFSFSPVHLPVSRHHCLPPPWSLSKREL